MAHDGAGSQRFKSLTQQLEAYMAETEEDRRKMEQEKADLKKKEDGIRDALQAEFDKKGKDLQEMFDAKQDELQGKWETREAEMRDWEAEKERVKKTKVFEKVITLNVGGTRYTTTLSTLTKYPDSMLGAMFSGRHNLPQQEDGSYFIDRDGEAFRYILIYLRDRDQCFAALYDDRHCKDEPQDLQLPSPLDSSLLNLLAYEAQYFQLRELETKVRIILNPNRAQFQTGYYIATDWHHGNPKPQCYDLDYGKEKLDNCYQLSQQNSWQKSPYTHYIIDYIYDERQLKVEHTTAFQEKITFDSCDLSGVTFRNCYFQKGVSFEGCILRGTKFERVGGLVRHKVHFAPWQVAQADFEPELLQALKDNGCIY